MKHILRRSILTLILLVAHLNLLLGLLSKMFILMLLSRMCKIIMKLKKQLMI
uniref:Uncharacterized protein n=1 Tax=Siphoviridae sp. ctxMM9 TaxID=2827973 RepID=A0A8S5T7I5_9CAUD|nr:MAG TPA: hypothetical protein [Siphoviridae sp. ctxMM9]